MLDDLKIARLAHLKAKDLIRYNKRIQNYLDLILSDFQRVREITQDKGYESSIFEPFPSDRHLYSLGKHFQNVSDLKSWAVNSLFHKVVVAVDGSQISFDRHVRPQVGMVQTGYSVFVRESPSGNHVAYQGIFPRLYGPDDVIASLDEDTGQASASIINYWRWEHEVKTVKCIITKLKGETPSCRECEDSEFCPLDFDSVDTSRDVIVLLDGTLILSFLRHTVRKVVRDLYIEKLEELLSFCERHGIPIGGVISNSSARELSKSLWSLLSGERNVEKVEKYLPTDAYLFSKYLKSFGDRSPFMLSHRSILKEYKVYGSKIGFFYVKVDSQNPIRIEAPSFVYDQDKLDILWRSMAAECVFGRGYPYSLARAHELAVLGSEERNRFYRILDQVLKSYGGCVHLSSKNRRKNVKII